MQLEIAIEGPWDDRVDWEALAHRCAEALAQIAPELDNARLVTSLLFASDEDIQTLNRDWRGKDKPTNVLSFPMLERAELLALDGGGPPQMFGDIALAHGTCAREAAEKGLKLADHAAHLIVHGLLHLAGHDHDVSDEAAQVMEDLEIKALALIGLANPYGDGDNA